MRRGIRRRIRTKGERKRGRGGKRDEEGDEWERI